MYLYIDNYQLEEDLEEMLQLEGGLRNKDHVLNLCRLMVRTEEPVHRRTILNILQVKTFIQKVFMYLRYRIFLPACAFEFLCIQRCSDNVIYLAHSSYSKKFWSSAAVCHCRHHNQLWWLLLINHFWYSIRITALLIMSECKLWLWFPRWPIWPPYWKLCW